MYSYISVKPCECNGTQWAITVYLDKILQYTYYVLESENKTLTEVLTEAEYRRNE